jgi:hypothetical protein
VHYGKCAEASRFGWEGTPQGSGAHSSTSVQAAADQVPSEDSRLAGQSLRRPAVHHESAGHTLQAESLVPGIEVAYVPSSQSWQPPLPLPTLYAPSWHASQGPPSCPVKPAAHTQTSKPGTMMQLAVVLMNVTSWTPQCAPLQPSKHSQDPSPMQRPWREQVPPMVQVSVQPSA